MAGARNQKRGGARDRGEAAEHVAPIENPHGLTTKELLFVAAYTGVALGNASKAYQLAGYSGKGSIQRTNACRLLTKDRVQQAIAERLVQRVERLSVLDGDEAIGRISLFARADIGKVLGPDDPIAKLPDDVRFVIKSVRPNVRRADEPAAGLPIGPVWEISLAPSRTRVHNSRLARLSAGTLIAVEEEA